MIQLDPLLQKALATVKSHRLEEDGAYTRWLHCLPQGETVRINEYGCADAANILYTLNEFVQDPAERAGWIKTLRGLQNPETGMYNEATHHPIHTTAHCIAALELFDAMPLYPLKGLDKETTVEGMRALLEGLDWLGRPWPMSHRGAGMYAALAITRAVGPEWKKAYFDWIWENTDPTWGMSNKGTIDGGTAPASHHMCGWFHYMFNMEHGKAPLRYPDALIDSLIAMYEKKELAENFGRTVGFMEIDWVFCMNRASRQTGHRFEETKALLWDFAKDYVAYLDGIEPTKHQGFDDLHMLFGAMCCLAELQQALPGKIHSTIPLRLVLDRRPFI